MHSEAEFLFWDKNCPFMTNNKDLSKKSKPYMYTIKKKEATGIEYPAIRAISFLSIV
jgi:hypothetical protein